MSHIKDGGSIKDFGIRCFDSTYNIIDITKPLRTLTTNNGRPNCGAFTHPNIRLLSVYEMLLLCGVDASKINIQAPFKL